MALLSDFLSALAPGQVSGSVSNSDEDLNRGYLNSAAFNALLANQGLQKNLGAQEDPSEVARMRNQAKEYLHQGVATLNDIGKSSGMNEAQLRSLASTLAGGMPQSGRIGGIDIIGSPLANMASQEADAAKLQNEYQLQRGKALAQIGAPGAVNQYSQDVSNYNLPGLVSAMANPSQAAALTNSMTEQQRATFRSLLEAQQEKRAAGVPYTAGQVSYKSPTGVKSTAEIGGVAMPANIIKGQMSEPEQTATRQQEQDIQNFYSSLSGVNNPTLINPRYDAVDKTLDGIMASSNRLFPGGKYKVGEGDLTPAQRDLITQGKWDQVQQVLGSSTPVGQALTIVQQLQGLPGTDDVIKNTLSSISANGTIDINSLKNQVRTAKRKYVQDSQLAPIMVNNVQHIQDSGAAGRTNIGELKNLAIEKGYDKPISTSEAKLVQEALNGLNVDQEMLNTAPTAQGYAADALNAGISQTSKKEIQQRIEQSLGDIDPVVKSKISAGILKKLSGMGGMRINVAK